MNDNRQIYKKNQALAKQLMQDDATFSRADLAFELKDYGVKTDSIDVSRLVYEAFKNTNDNAIKVSFVTNDGAQYIVSEYEVNGLIDSRNTDKLTAVTSQRLSSTANSLAVLQDRMNM